jgi:hypothetical protein
MQFFANFPNKQSKIKYLCDNCKDTAYTIVKLYSLPNSLDLYITVSELFTNL